MRHNFRNITEKKKNILTMDSFMSKSCGGYLPSLCPCPEKATSLGFGKALCSLILNDNVHLTSSGRRQLLRHLRTAEWGKGMGGKKCTIMEGR